MEVMTEEMNLQGIFKILKLGSRETGRSQWFTRDLLESGANQNGVVVGERGRHHTSFQSLQFV